MALDPALDLYNRARAGGVLLALVEVDGDLAGEPVDFRLVAGFYHNLFERFLLDGAALLDRPQEEWPAIEEQPHTHTRLPCHPNFQQNAPTEIIAALEDAETKAATRAIGAAAARDAKMQRVKEDLGQLRSYVQSVVATTGSPVDAAAMVKSAFMSVRKPTTRNVPELSAKNADVSGKVILAAKSLGPSVVYSWEYSLDQSKWIPITDTMKARTEVTGLAPHNTHYFRFSPLTRDGRQGYSQVVSLFVH